jgi:excisionase family DNA binding protein
MTAASRSPKSLGQKIPPPSERFWTPKQVADRWLVSARTVRRLIEAGELRACRMGKQIRIRHADLLAYEHGQTITPECPA